MSASILVHSRCPVNPSQITTIKHAHKVQCLSNPMESKGEDIESHPKPLKARSHLGLQTGCFESLVNRPKTAQGSISVSPGVTPDTGREPQGEALEDRIFRKCRARVGSHTLDDRTPNPPGRPPKSIRSPCLCLHVLTPGQQRLLPRTWRDLPGGPLAKASDVPPPHTLEAGKGLADRWARDPGPAARRVATQRTEQPGSPPV